MYSAQSGHIDEGLEGHNLVYNGPIVLKFRIRVYGARDTRSRLKMMLRRKKWPDEALFFEIWPAFARKTAILPIFSAP